MRLGADAILVGINTIIADNPSLTWRRPKTTGGRRATKDGGDDLPVHEHRLRRIILDAHARTPLNAQVVSDESASLTTIVVSEFAPKTRLRALAKRANILIAPSVQSSKFRVQGSRFAPSLTVDLRWLLKTLGSQEVTSLLVEGGGEVNGSFLLHGLAHRIAFFYAPKVLGGRDARKGVAGPGVGGLNEAVKLAGAHWRRLGDDWLLTAHLV